MSINRGLIVLVAMLMTLSAFASNTTKHKSSKIVEYKVKSGDILYTIAHAHHTTIKEVRELNNLSENDHIRVGQILKVPTNTYFPNKKKDNKSTNKDKNSKKESRADNKSKRVKSSKEVIYHIVKSGETLGGIAHKYGLKTGELKRLNGLDKSNYIIRVGMKLRVSKAPTKSKNSKSKSRKEVAKRVPKPKREIVKVKEFVDVKKVITHTVVRGDTLVKISNKYGVNIKEIRKLNNIPMGTPIRLGQKIKIIKREKKAKIKSIEVTTHIVKKGERLSSIAKKYKMSLDELKRINHLDKNSKIVKGMRLKVATLKRDSSKRASKSNKRDVSKKSEKRKVAKKSKVRYKVVTKHVIKVITHRVKKGEKLSDIAQKYGMDLDDLKEINGLSKKSKIDKGMRLKVVKLVTVRKKVKIEEPKEEKSPPKSIKVAKNIEKRSPPKREDSTASKHQTPQERIISLLTSNPITPKIKKLINGEKYYTVGNGDMLFSIARKEHVSLKELMKLNKIGVTDIIKPGQKLKIPLTDSEKKLVARAKKLAREKEKLSKIYKVEKRVTTHKVKHGDTLWKIAKKYGVSVDDIRRLNGMSKKSLIHKNMVLTIKRETLLIPKKIKKIYIVKSGDTLWKIAHKNGVSIADIKRWNKLGKKVVLHKGMKLTLIFSNNKPLKLDKKLNKRVRVAKSKKSKKGKSKRYAKRKKRYNRNPMDIFKSSTNSENVIKIAKRYLGKRYVWGAEGPNQFDCSGFTQYVMKKSKGIKIPRVSRRQAYYGKYVSMRNLKPGDLIFFDTSRGRRGYVNHVGIYIGNHKFIHASSARHRVVITSLNRPFYRSRFKWGRRIN